MYNLAQAPEAMCNNVKLVSMNDLSMACLVFNVYKLYSVPKFEAVYIAQKYDNKLENMALLALFSN